MKSLVAYMVGMLVGGLAALRPELLSFRTAVSLAGWVLLGSVVYIACTVATASGKHPAGE